MISHGASNSVISQMTLTVYMWNVYEVKQIEAKTKVVVARDGREGRENGKMLSKMYKLSIR